MTTSRLPEPRHCAASARPGTSLLSNSNTSNANRPGLDPGRNVGDSELQQNLRPEVNTVEQLPPYCRLSSPHSSSTSSDSGGHRDDESSDEMDDCPQSIKGLGSMEPEVSSLHRIALSQALPIAGDLPSHAISHVTSPSLGFGLSLSEHESSGMPHHPDPSAHYHATPSPHTLPTSIVQAHSQLPPPTSSPTLFSAQRGVIHPILTREGLSATFAQSHYPSGHDSDSEESQVCLWDNCGRDFSSLSALVVHLDRDHTLSMVKYVCMWKNCQRGLKPFDARYKLITHLRCHTGEKPYKCEVSHCARSFSRLENLKLHVRTHTGEKPYVCHYDGCNKRFNNTSDRAKHMKTHVTRKPYACKYPGCGKSYTDPSSMRKHIKFAHKLREQNDAPGGDVGASGGGVTTILSPRRKKSSSSSSSSPRTPQTPSTGITMLVSRPSLTSPSPLTPTVLPTSPPNTPQQALYIQTPLVTSGNNNNNNPGVVITMAPPTSSLVTAPAPSMMRPQMVGMAIQSSPGQRLFFPSGNPQQPLLMVLPSVGSAPNGTTASGYGTVDSSTLQQLRYNGSKVNTHQGLVLPVTTAAQSDGGSHEKVRLLSNGTASQRPRPPGGGMEAIQVVRNGAVSVEEEGGTTVENELRKKIAHLQQQLRMYQSQTDEVQEVPGDRQTREERKHGISSSPSATTVPSLQHQLTSCSPQLMRGASPNKITLVASSSSSPQVRGQIMALPATTTSPQFPLAMGAALPAQYTLLHTSSSGQAVRHLSHSPSRAIVNASQHVLGMPSGEQTVLPQIMLSASPVGAQLLPVSVVQPPGVMAPQILQLTPALHVNSSKT